MEDLREIWESVICKTKHRGRMRISPEEMNSKTPHTVRQFEKMVKLVIGTCPSEEWYEWLDGCSSSWRETRLVVVREAEFHPDDHALQRRPLTTKLKTRTLESRSTKPISAHVGSRLRRIRDSETTEFDIFWDRNSIVVDSDSVRLSCIRHVGPPGW